MKEILKRAMIPVFLSIILGGICGRVVYKIYLDDSGLGYDDNIIYLIQSGEYSSYDNMRADTVGYDYVYYEEDKLYKTVIGITKNKDNIDKIKNVYDGEVSVFKYYTDDILLNKELTNYDNILQLEEDNDKIMEIVVKMLNLYKDNSDAKLIKVS